MLKLFSAFRKEKIWDFDGGIHPPEMKSQSNGTPLRQIPLATRYVMPLKQHIGAEGELCVKEGDSVLRGQPLTFGRGRMLPIHAPTSGKVVAVAPHTVAHPSALSELSVIIEADGEDRWIDRDGWSDYRCHSREALIERIHQFGVAGLGGAGFPTGAKLHGGGEKIETLIINAAECEPYITADDRPLTERVVTLTGESVSRPGNVWARLGTPVRHLLEQAGFCPGSDQLVIMGGPLMGFTLPWLDVPVVKITNCLLAPSPTEMGETQEEKGCIRCSACADACPADLLPQQLYWYSKGQLHDKAQAHNLADCIECGACAWVCPSNIPLVQYFRQEKAEIYAISMEEKRAAEAKARFEARQARLEREKQARQERHKQAAVQPAAKDQDAINAALARVREKKATAAQTVVIAPGERPDNSEAIAAREARKAEARARQAEKAQHAKPEADIDPRKAAVEAAIARAKARKAGQQTVVVEQEATDPRKAAVEAAIARAKARKAAQVQPAEESEAPVDPRKAAVEAAIARAKARKAAQQDERPAAANDDPRKAAVAAAIARVQAKKAAQQAVNED
ncbi:electron transport complex subunit RsxC [Enterobacter hormaechei]|uniref:electron transport complex subunit RsxC n=1 Tax=Enterobacter hormaechei TaxID=158836 RepID=UPI001FAC98C1|nr:electron transport complex subunit RsxC [Enterobacter hormaechei]MCJ0722372.1 electron transport complex subunit RsxC [Enterobacter hormaechei]